MRSPEAERHFNQAKEFADQGRPSNAPDGAGGNHLTMSAILEAKAALKLSPSDPEILLFLSGQLNNTLLTRDALVCLDEGLQAARAAGRRDLLVRMKTFHAYLLEFHLHDHDGARRALDEALTLGPDDKEALQLRSIISSLEANREKDSVPPLSSSGAGGNAPAAARPGPRIGILLAIGLLLLLTAVALTVALRMFRKRG